MPFSLRTRSHRHSRRLLLALAALSLAACDASFDEEESLCAPTVAPLSSKAGKTRATAHIYWDVSKSMKRFAGSDGPLTALNTHIESTVLQGSKVLQFEHYTVADAVESMSPLQQPLRLTGNWSNLPELANSAGRVFVDPSAPTMTLMISDMKVETPPNLRKRKEGVEVPCGLPISAIPSTEEAPYLLRECMKSVLGDSPVETEGWMSAVRWEVGDRALYAVLASRDHARGQAVHNALVSLDSTATASSQVLFDFPPDLADGLDGGGLCRFDPGVDDPVAMNRGRPGEEVSCRFRFRSSNAPAHTLRCAIPAIRSVDTNAAVQPTIAGISRGGTPIQASVSEGWYDIQTAPGSASANDTLQHTFSSTLAPGATDTLISWCSEPNSTAGQAIAGLADAIAGRLSPAASSGWRVQYEGQ